MNETKIIKNDQFSIGNHKKLIANMSDLVMRWVKINLPPSLSIKGFDHRDTWAGNGRTGIVMTFYRNQM